MTSLQIRELLIHQAIIGNNFKIEFRADNTYKKIIESEEIYGQYKITDNGDGLYLWSSPALISGKETVPIGLLLGFPNNNDGIFIHLSSF